jgi:hypothetical protein
MSIVRNVLFICATLLLTAGIPALFGKATIIITPTVAKTTTTDYYDNWNLTASGLSKEAFDYALKGFNHLLAKNKLTNKNIITIVDYSKASFEKRLYVLDMSKGEILFHTLAAHGKNSGLVYADNFSNAVSSFKTSLGFFVTGNTYNGNNGYSLKLQGCEKGINDKALQRAIVMHGANYVSEKFIANTGYLGRSHGCPAVPENLSREIIDVIKNGSCVFLYYPQKKYITHSKILNSKA